MTQPAPLPRPRQVTVIGGFAIGVSLLLVASLFDAMSAVRSVSTRQSLETALSTSPWDGLGLSVDQAVSLLRLMVLLTGALAAASFVLAIFILRGHNGARIAFTVVAALLLGSYPVASFLPLTLAVAAAMLWSPAVRDWFAGRPPAEPTRDDSGPRRPNPFLLPMSSDRAEPGRPSGATPPAEGGPSSPYGQPPASPETAAEGEDERPPVGAPPPPPPAPYPYGQPPQVWAPVPAPGVPQGPPPAPYPYGQPPGAAAPEPPAAPPGYPPPPPGYPQMPPGPPPGYPPVGYPPPGYSQMGPGGGYQPGPASDSRPTTVSIAAFVTWIMTGLTAAFCVLGGIVVAATPSMITDQLNQDPNAQNLNLTTGEVIALVLVMLGIAVVWCVSAFVLAVFVYRGAGWARIALTVSAGMTVLVSLAMILSLVSVVTLIAAAAVIVLLYTGGANDWFSRGRGGGTAEPRPPVW